jgi:glycosyltransferase involved in cell wall biosynthesis
MNILLINHYSGSNKLGMQFRPYYLAREWIKLGHSVTIIGGTYAHARNLQTKAGEEIYNGINYIWIKTRRYRGNSIGRVISIIQFVLKIWFSANKIALKVKPYIVIASSIYPLDIYPANKIAKIAKAKLCFELHDLWPLSPLQLGGYSGHHPFIRIMQRAEDFYCKHSDIVVSILPLTREYLKGRGLDEKKFFYIPNGIALEELSETGDLSFEMSQKLNNLRTKYNFIIAYTGAHGTANALSVLIDVASRLSDDGIAVVLIGRGPEREGLKSYVREKKVNNVYFFDPVPKSEIPAILNQFDALYIGLQNKSLFQFGISPNKIFDYMMAAKPIIQAIDSGNNLVEEADCGVSAKAGNVEEIAKVILHLKSLTAEERERLGRNGRAFVLMNHTYSVLARKFLNAISN